MRSIAIALLAALTLATVVEAQSYPGPDYYTNASGHHVRRPVHADHAPPGATAKCRDGSYSFSEHHQGTCSHHGGVAAWL
jgi:hypothetical protein